MIEKRQNITQENDMELMYDTEFMNLLKPREEGFIKGILPRRQNCIMWGRNYNALNQIALEMAMSITRENDFFGHETNFHKVVFMHNNDDDELREYLLAQPTDSSCGNLLFMNTSNLLAKEGSSHYPYCCLEDVIGNILNSKSDIDVFIINNLWRFGDMQTCSGTKRLFEDIRRASEKKEVYILALFDASSHFDYEEWVELEDNDSRKKYWDLCYEGIDPLASSFFDTTYEVSIGGKNRIYLENVCFTHDLGAGHKLVFKNSDNKLELIEEVKGNYYEGEW